MDAYADQPWTWPAARDRTSPHPSLATETDDQPFSSSLDPEETKSGNPEPEHFPSQVTEDPAVTFRHSFWRARREKVIESAAVVAPTQKNALLTCGATAWILRNDDNPQDLRIACNKCHNRWCEACAGEKRRRVTFALRDHLLTLKGTHLRCLTLTLKTTGEPLKNELDRLYESFRKFRTRPKIAAAMQGGVAFLEITYSSKSDGWHPHLHVLFVGGFLPQPVAAHEWHMITQDSYIVDVRAVRDEAAVGYVAKYLGKTVPANIFHHAHLLQEAMEALHGRRTYATFGTWRGVKLGEVKQLDGNWTTIGTLASFITAAHAGDEEAQAVLDNLRRSNREPVDTQPETEDTS